jgi:hypothetical protein
MTDWVRSLIPSPQYRGQRKFAPSRPQGTTRRGRVLLTAIAVAQRAKVLPFVCDAMSPGACAAGSSSISFMKDLEGNLDD